jgi:fatty acid desaturase
LLSRDEIRAFTRTSNLRGAVAVLGTWAIIAAAFALVIAVPNPATVIAAVVVIGGRQLALAVAMHEGAHGTLFRTRWLNDVVADALCGRPVGSSVARYRKHHLSHHAFTGTDRDPDLELAPLVPMSRASLARKIGRDLVGIAGLRRVVGLVLVDSGLLSYNVGGKAKWTRRRFGVHVRVLARNIWPTVVANAAIFGALALAGAAWAYLVWAAAWLTTFGLFLRIRMLAEHACLARGDDILRNTRTTRANLLARATVAPLHVNYHLEHHLLPMTPWFRLPALHRVVRERTAALAPAFARGYIDVLATVSH